MKIIFIRENMFIDATDNGYWRALDMGVDSYNNSVYHDYFMAAAQQHPYRDFSQYYELMKKYTWEQYEQSFEDNSICITDLSEDAGDKFWLAEIYSLMKLNYTLKKYQ